MGAKFILTFLRRHLKLERTISLPAASRCIYKTKVGKVACLKNIIGVTGIIVQPVLEDGSPLEGAKVTLKCTDPEVEFLGVENPIGKYIFDHGIPGDGRIECELMVEKEG